MVEMGVEDFKSLMSFKNGKVSVDNKPCLMFSGIGFSESSELMCLKSILIDFFKVRYNSKNSAMYYQMGIFFRIFNEYIFGLPQGTLTVTFFAYKISQNVVSSIQKLINTIIKSKNV